MLRPGLATLTSALFFAVAFGSYRPNPKPATTPPTFYRDVLPILQQHCQTCHRPGEIAPTPLVTYEQTKAMARLIRDDTRSKRMPPWFADPCCGHFADDPSLTDCLLYTSPSPRDS